MMCVDGKGRTFISLSFLLLVSEMSHTLTAERKQVGKCGSIPTRSAEVAAPGTVPDSARAREWITDRYVPGGAIGGYTAVCILRSAAMHGRHNVAYAKLPRRDARSFVAQSTKLADHFQDRKHL
ncbi:hypothetical protein B0T13DRAFT_197679 [Neurospora crassa]|nr:hypothetical protein B0T13DRAFT_197679 [Neurospora crassa]